jgi:hypothetical protein
MAETIWVAMTGLIAILGIGGASLGVVIGSGMR